MAVEKGTLENLLNDAFPNADIRIDDVRGDGEYYAANIIAPDFVGKNRVQQHQMVYAALKDLMQSDLHALQINTSVPQ